MRVLFLFTMLWVVAISQARIFMSYNVQHCNIGGTTVDEKQTAAVINKVKPDVCAIQELDSCNTRSKGYQLQLLAGYTGMNYTYARTIAFKGGAYGIGILSKEKPLSVKRIPLPGSEARMLLVCEFEDYVYACTHLCLQEANRLTSVGIISQEAQLWDKPFILAGDFNALPTSTVMTNFKKSFTLLSDDTQPTHPASAPTKCIDYIILYNQNQSSQLVQVLDYTVMNEPTVSDHRPIYVTLNNWKNKPAMEPLQLTVERVADGSKASAKMPEGFPSNVAADASPYKSAYQATAADGIIITNDCNTQHLLTYTGREVQDAVHFETTATGTSSYGITTDDANNLLLRNDDNSDSPHQLIAYSHADKNQSAVINFTLPHPGKTPFISASGDIFSAEGGYVYFYPNNQYYVDILNIQAGELKGILSSEKLTAAGSSSYVAPVGNNPTQFYYQVRTKGIYQYLSSDKGLFLPYESTQAPRLNSTTGIAYLTLDDHELIVHPSGANYNGGFSIKDISANNETLHTSAPLGTAGVKGNPSYAQFFKVEKISPSAAYLYVYSMGNGYAVYLLKTPQATGIHLPTVPTNCTDGNLYDLSGSQVAPSQLLRGKIYIENHRKFRKR